MEITFCLPHIVSPTSNVGHNNNAIKALHSCVDKIKSAYLQYHGSSSPPRVTVVSNGNGYYTFDLPHAFYPGASEVDNAYTLRALLDCLIEINQWYLVDHQNTPELYATPVVYGRTQIWDTIPAMYARGYGDCKSLTAALVAENSLRGKKSYPVFRFVKNRHGSNDFHILVQNPDGFEDPSKIKGMGLNENAYFRR